MVQRKVLFIAPQPFYVERGTPINVRETVRVLGQAGYEVDLLVMPFGSDVFLPNVRIVRGIRIPGIHNLKIGPSWAKFALDLPLFLQALKRVLFKKYDLIHGVEEGGVMAWLLSRISGVPFIFDVDSNMPAQLESSGFIRSKLLLLGLSRIEKRCLRDAKVVLSVCEALSSRAKNIAPSAHVVQVEDFAVPEALRPDPVSLQLWRQRLGLSGRKCILYTGNFESYQGLDLLFQAVASLKGTEFWEEHRPVLVLVGGDGNPTVLLQSTGLTLESELIFISRQPLNQIGTFLELADVLVSPRLSGENTPLKIFTYLAAGKAIVATNTESHTQVLNEDSAYLSPVDVDAFAKTLVRALSSDVIETSARMQRIARAQTLARTRYSFPVFRMRVENLYSSVFGVSKQSENLQVQDSVDKESCLVTGAGGFVGSRLVAELCRQGHRVRAMVRSVDQGPALEKLGAEVIYADLLDDESLRHAVAGVSRVFHIAALFRKAALSDEMYWRVNRDAVKRLLDISREFGVRRFIHCSTVGVHGDVQSPPGNETSPFAPGDLYQRTKLEGEKIAFDYFRSGLMNGVVIRPAMIYGPNDRRTLKLFKGVAERKFFYVGSGESFVHFVDVRDLARAFILAMNAEQRNGEAYIIAGKRALPLCDLVEAIAILCGTTPPNIHLPVRPVQMIGEVCEAICKPFGIEPPIYRRRVDFFTKNRHFDWSKSRRELNYVPAQTLDNELRDIITSYISEGWLKAPYYDDKPSKALAPSSVMIRDVYGNIMYWDAGAEQIYGWQGIEAVGNVSHEILKTEFETPLSTINAQLRKLSKWNGPLTHTTRDGRKIKVASRWIHLPGADDRVYEINRPINKDQSPNIDRRDRGIFEHISGVIPTSLPELFEQIQLGLNFTY